jgi:hypothetical protein
MFRELLRELLQIPGANFCCIADGAMGKVIGSAGSTPDEGSGVALAVLGWGSTAAGYLSAAASDELDDLIITSRRAYHLVRRLDGRSGQPLLIYLRLDRQKANLAVARRALSSARAGGTPVPHQRTLLVLEETAAHSDVMEPARASVSAAPMAPARTPADRQAAPTRRQVAALPSPRRPRPAPRAVPRAGPPPSPPPLPRRTAEPPPPAAPRPTGGAGLPTVAGQHWADDGGTMKRLLAALRRLG